MPSEGQRITGWRRLRWWLRPWRLRWLRWLRWLRRRRLRWLRPAHRCW
ncbi:MAG TPA: hypothetical protein VE888_20615 [Streptosporangiaceae bacterium]|nr:hypothetical protein [Streptosporangiaceae bacterium]